MDKQAPNEKQASTYSPRFSRAGVHVNGWTLSWPFLLVVAGFISNASIAHHRLGEMEKDLTAIQTVDRGRIRALEIRITALETRAKIRDDFDPMRRPGP